MAASYAAFAAVKADGSVVTWGDPNCGGDSSEADHGEFSPCVVSLAYYNIYIHIVNMYRV